MMAITLDDIARQLTANKPEQGWIAANMLFLHMAGSHLYGTSGPGSDLDVRGVTIAPKDHWVGARRFESVHFTMNATRSVCAGCGRDRGTRDCGCPAGSIEHTSKVDVVIYDIRRWLALTVDCNPNVIETLYVDRELAAPGILLAQNAVAWQSICADTLPLISQRAHSGFKGYAESQMKKLLAKQANKSGRQDLVEKFGYDTKFMSHAFRLVRQGSELLRTGAITFPHPSAAFLRAVREGRAFPNEQAAIDQWKKESMDLDVAMTESVLPVKPDFEAYNRLLMSIYDCCVK